MFFTLIIFISSFIFSIDTQAMQQRAAIISKEHVEKKNAEFALKKSALFAQKKILELKIRNTYLFEQLDKMRATVDYESNWIWHGFYEPLPQEFYRYDLPKVGWEYRYQREDYQSEIDQKVKELGNLEREKKSKIN